MRKLAKKIFCGRRSRKEAEEIANLFRTVVQYPMVNKNYYAVWRIENPVTLLRLAEEKKAVFNCNIGVKPAAFVLHMQLATVVKMIKTNGLFEVKRKEEKHDYNYKKT